MHIFDGFQILSAGRPGHLLLACSSSDDVFAHAYFIRPCPKVIVSRLIPVMMGVRE